MTRHNGRTLRATVPTQARSEDLWVDTKGVIAGYTMPTPRGLEWACASHPDPDLFWPTDLTSHAEAIEFCSGCPAKDACLSLGVARAEYGVWGGVLLEGGKPLDKPRMPGRPKSVVSAA